MTKSDLENEIKYLKQCCSEAGLELQKYSYEYDYKEKNLVIQAKKCNEIISELKKENSDLKLLVSKMSREIIELSRGKNEK
jgi:hypothetical protein